MTIVIDASMALAWVFERQQAADAARANRLLSACGEQGWWVPGLWHLEMVNALLVAERRGVIDPETSDLFLTRLRSLPVITDHAPTTSHQPHWAGLARTHALSSYDAAYLELAQRLGASLASFDRALNKAALSAGVTLFEP